MDGMTEACVKGGIEACYTSVSCACALLSALDELLKGRGIQPEQVRTLLSTCFMFAYCLQVFCPFNNNFLFLSSLHVLSTGSASTPTPGRPEGRV